MAGDLFKPVRAAISNMLNGKAGAWKDSKGVVKTLQPREGMRAIGKGKKAPKPKSEKGHRSSKRRELTNLTFPWFGNLESRNPSQRWMASSWPLGKGSSNHENHKATENRSW